MSKTWIAIAACFAVGWIPVSAQTRTWIKYHTVAQMDGDTLAQYTHILTRDQVSPFIERFLYEDSTGTRLVLRSESSFVIDEGLKRAQSLILSVEMLGTNERITFTVSNGTGTLAVGAGQLEYQDDDEWPIGLRQQGLSLLANNSSEAFRAALARLANVGSRHSQELGNFGYSLTQAFLYPAIVIRSTTNDNTSGFGVLDYPFDPSATPPGTFELPFGQAYYQ